MLTCISKHWNRQMNSWNDFYYKNDYLTLNGCLLWVNIPSRLWDPFWHGPWEVRSCMEGAHSARTLYFFTESLNNCFQKVYSSRWVFLTIQKKNWPNCFEIGRVIIIFVSTANFWKKLDIFSNLNNFVNS